MTRVLRFLLSGSMILLLGGCPTASDDDDSVADDDDSVADDDDSVADDDDSVADDDDSAPTVSFSGDVLAIVSANCSCHAVPPGPGGWAHDNDGPTLYAAWVGTAAAGLSTMNRIEPFDPANSYVWHKINGDQASVGGIGSQMPLGGSPTWLPQADRDTIRTWIEEGALDN